MVRACDTEPYAASAKERAIACSSMVDKLRCNSKVRSDGNARARRKSLSIPAESRGISSAKLVPNEDRQSDDADDEKCPKEQFAESDVIDHFILPGRLHGFAKRYRI